MVVQVSALLLLAVAASPIPPPRYGPFFRAVRQLSIAPPFSASPRLPRDFRPGGAWLKLGNSRIRPGRGPPKLPGPLPRPLSQNLPSRLSRPTTSQRPPSSPRAPLSADAAPALPYLPWAVNSDIRTALPVQQSASVYFPAGGPGKLETKEMPASPFPIVEISSGENHIFEEPDSYGLPHSSPLFELQASLTRPDEYGLPKARPLELDSSEFDGYGKPIEAPIDNLPFKQDYDLLQQLKLPARHSQSVNNQIILKVGFEEKNQPIRTPGAADSQQQAEFVDQIYAGFL